MSEIVEDEKNGPGYLMESLKLHAIIEVTHLIDSGKYDEACKVAKAVERMSRI